MVRVENADEYIRSLLPAHGQTVIKIDVEGHEGQILNALRAWIGEAVPGFVLFECHVGHAGFWSEEWVIILKQLNYPFFGYDLTGYWETRLYRLSADDEFPAGDDFVAVQSGALETPAGLCFQNMVLNGIKRYAS